MHTPFRHIGFTPLEEIACKQVPILFGGGLPTKRLITTLRCESLITIVAQASIHFIFPSSKFLFHLFLASKLFFPPCLFRHPSSVHLSILLTSPKKKKKWRKSSRAIIQFFTRIYKKRCIQQIRIYIYFYMIFFFLNFFSNELEFSPFFFSFFF